MLRQTASRTARQGPNPLPPLLVGMPVVLLPPVCMQFQVIPEQVQVVLS